MRIRLSAVVLRQVQANLTLAGKKLRQASGLLHGAEKAIDMAWANIQTERARPPAELARSADEARRLHIASANLSERLSKWRKTLRLEKRS